MRLSELLDVEVRDRDGRRVGRVVDIRLVQDGPVQFPYGAALRVDGFIVAERELVRMLGYERDVRPAIFRRLIGLAHGTVRFVGFAEVERLPDGTLRAAAATADLPLLDDVPARR